jgi:outer membrane protein OmpA-like peptidoglycan-associated protein
MLAIVLILCMVIAAVSVSSFPIDELLVSQAEVSRDDGFKTAGYRLVVPESAELGSAEWWRIDGPQTSPVFIFSVNPAEPYLQRISFSDSILFPSDDWKLSDEGRAVLTTLADVIKPRVGTLEQIQIHGHADNREPLGPRDNLELASFRANAVFRFLVEEVPLKARIDPISEVLMSATSFGSYSPTGRSARSQYSAELLCLHNGTTFDPAMARCTEVTESSVHMDLNRRVEVWLYYKASVNK